MFRRKKKPAREPPEVFGYDRDALVSLVKRHYQLLVDMGHLHPEAVQAPPEPAGWSDAELNVDALRALGRSETVIDLLRHLPYPQAGPPSSDAADDDAIVYYETMVRSYLRNKWQPEQDEDPNWHQLPFAMLGLGPFDKPVPPHIVSLTHEEAEVGVIWVIDTERGWISPSLVSTLSTERADGGFCFTLPAGCVYPQGDDYYLYDDAPPEAEEDKPWLGAKALSFKTFFDKMHHEISSLKLVPAPAAGNFGAAICAPKDAEAKAIKSLYREYGWPDAFRKEEFLRAAVPARAAIKNDQYDWSDED